MFHVLVPYPSFPLLLTEKSLGKNSLKVSLGRVPRDAGTPNGLWGTTILMCRRAADSLVIAQIYVNDDGTQTGLTKYAWATERKASMQALIDKHEKWPDIVHEPNGLSFNCADPECAADDGVENMRVCVQRRAHRRR